MALGVAAALAGTVLSCRYLLPERFAVNAPLAHLIFGRGGDAPPDDALGSRIRVPEGFSIGIFAADLPGLRFLRFTATGDLLVSQPRSDRVVLLHRDEDGLRFRPRGLMPEERFRME